MGSFRLEVPEYPALGLALECGELGFDVSSHVVLERIIPGGDVTLATTAAHEC